MAFTDYTDKRIEAIFAFVIAIFSIFALAGLAAFDITQKDDNISPIVYGVFGGAILRVVVKKGSDILKALSQEEERSDGK